MKKTRNREAADPDMNIVYQLKKVTTMRNAPPPVLFGDGSREAVSFEEASRALDKLASLRSADSKEAFTRDIGATLTSLQRAIMPYWVPSSQRAPAVSLHRV